MSRDGSFAANDVAPSPDASAGPTHAPAADLSGRWTGTRAGFGARSDAVGCDEQGRCLVTYDITRCGENWCGVRVLPKETCGTATLSLTKIGDVPGRGGSVDRFSGHLELSPRADSFVVEAFFLPAHRVAELARPDDPLQPVKAARLSLIGDTGAELLMFRRSFPFRAELVWQGPAKCAPLKPVS